MFYDANKTGDAILHPRFRAGDKVVLTVGPHRFVHGVFLRLKDDVEWAAIEQSNGQIDSHPVEWLDHYAEPKEEAVTDLVRVE